MSVYSDICEQLEEQAAELQAQGLGGSASLMRRGAQEIRMVREQLRKAHRDAQEDRIRLHELRRATQWQEKL